MQRKPKLENIKNIKLNEQNNCSEELWPRPLCIPLIITDVVLFMLKVTTVTY